MILSEEKVQKIILTLILGSAALLAACGQTDEITVRYNGRESTFEPSSSLIRQGTLTMNQGEKARKTEIHLANYHIDTSKGDLSVQQVIKRPDEVRVMIYLYGEKGTDENTPAKPGEYVNKPAGDNFNKVANIYIYYFKDGKEVPAMLNMNNNYKARVNLTSVTDDEISGTVDAVGGDLIVKGSFTAKR